MQKYTDDGNPWNEKDAYVRELWQTVDYEGAPIALQLVARHHHGKPISKLKCFILTRVLLDNFLFGAMDLLKGPLDLQ